MAATDQTSLTFYFGGAATLTGEKGRLPPPKETQALRRTGIDPSGQAIFHGR